MDSIQTSTLLGRKIESYPYDNKYTMQRNLLDLVRENNHGNINCVQLLDTPVPSMFDKELGENLIEMNFQLDQSFNAFLSFTINGIIIIIIIIIIFIIII